MKSCSSEWVERLRQLKEFRRAYGHARVPSGWAGDPSFAKWVVWQRNHFDRLPPLRLAELYRCGFDFGLDRYWISRFCELVAFKEAHGHCNVPSRWPENPQLGGWLSAQRARRDLMPIQRRKLLERLGVDWAPLQSAWNRHLDELRAFKADCGHCNVPAHWPENPQLALWVENQRQRHQRLSMLKRRLLTRLGFDWNPFETLRKKHWQELKEFKRNCGHCNVPAKWNQNAGLGSWVVELRARGRESWPLAWRKRLDWLGFEWTPSRDQWWETRFRELKAFKREHGHCNVPKGWPRNSKLGDWVSTQRAFQRQMPSDRKRRLNGLGFVWKMISISPRKDWDDRFQELIAFKKRFGHCDAPSDWPENRALANWAIRQRSRDKRKLTADQKRRLEKAGFCWNKRETNWERCYVELASFHRIHRHGDVPSTDPELRPLCNWVFKQRERRANLSPKRVQLLNELKFRWQ